MNKLRTIKGLGTILAIGVGGYGIAKLYMESRKSYDIDGVVDKATEKFPELTKNSNRYENLRSIAYDICSDCGGYKHNRDYCDAELDLRICDLARALNCGCDMCDDLGACREVGERNSCAYSPLYGEPLDGDLDIDDEEDEPEEDEEDELDEEEEDDIEEDEETADFSDVAADGLGNERCEGTQQKDVVFFSTFNSPAGNLEESETEDEYDIEDEEDELDEDECDMCEDYCPFCLQEANLDGLLRDDEYSFKNAMRGVKDSLYRIGTNTAFMLGDKLGRIASKIEDID